MNHMVRKLSRLAATAGMMATLWAGQALAQAADATAAAPAAPTPKLDSGDTAWMMTSSVLVLLMLVPGLGLFYGGLVRKKNVLAVLMQSVFGAGILSVLWIVLGYSLAFTEGNPIIGGFSRVLLSGVAPDTLAALAPTIPETVYAMFQCTFAIITAVIILGGPADRMKFSSAMVFVSVWVLAVYAPIAHMVWGPNGFLAGAGVLDFAGGTVVHINSAMAALVATLMVGKRSGAGTENMAPHNLVLTMIGGSLLWVGWFGFNSGSALTSGGAAGFVMINTHLATAAAIVSWTFAEWLLRGKPSLLGAVSGAVAGLVAITPAAGFVNPQGALIIGLLGGAGGYFGAVWLKRLLKYDDSLDAFGVHGIAGIIGALLTGVLADPAVNSLGEGASLMTQLYGVAITIAYASIGTFIILMIVKYTVGLRVSEEAEVEGLDLSQHGEALHD